MLKMDAQQTLGLYPDGNPPRLTKHAKLLLIANGLIPVDAKPNELGDATGLIAQFREQVRLLTDHRCPADQRIESFLADYFADLNLPQRLRLPDQTIVLSRHGIAKELSLPENGE